MKAKYGTEIELAGPIYTPKGMFDFIGWGTKWNLKDTNVTEAPIYSKKFWDGIAFEIEPEKEEQTITVMETNEEGEEVEVKKKVTVDVKQPRMFSKQYFDKVFQGNE